MLAKPIAGVVLMENGSLGWRIEVPAGVQLYVVAGLLEQVKLSVLAAAAQADQQAAERGQVVPADAALLRVLPEGGKPGARLRGAT